ncbi:isocitrate lyase/PEP mutase family protein [Opitutus terrae]|uniref:PEP phosphonomutase n=1 Tax=Opitutus terrae (strain DSM 11246 / JCM 15787 / PB90-1) TaxID=452637 RepID=B1ZZ96_OPITP|nr:isocitrate lyase/phosphoenolpyruvate mutase family protein [Opitutus terrae]ACB77168.1 conserved hypothetical protein [Opitutus terrae PB90-1]
MSTTQAEKAQQFRALHEHPGIFVIPNPWDAGSARILAGRGFKALATSSAAAAGALGRADHGLSRDEALAGARAIVQATHLPVSADLENGYGDSPENVAETIRRAAEVGLVGGSIEDGTNNNAAPLYDFGLATERVAAAVEAARALRFPFTLTARTEGFVCGRPDLDEAIRRLQAYERAGADVLFAPGLRDLASVRTVCSAVSRPVNFMNGMKGATFSVAALEAAGVKRISLAMSLYRAAMTALCAAADEIKEKGAFTYVERTLSSSELAPYWQP